MTKDLKKFCNPLVLGFSLTIFSILMGCSSPKEADGKALLINILLNGTQTSEYANVVSVIELQRVDPTSFQGRCIDTFLGITAYQFYVNNSYFLSGKKDTESKRTASTSKKCIDLGFRDPGGYVVSSTGGISFTTYECSPKNTVCSVSSLNAQLGSSNSNPKGAFGSYEF
jgi:hypothetical protein